jgi:hypothetical protein
MLTGVEYDRLSLTRVEDVWNYPASRCRSQILKNTLYSEFYTVIVLGF